MAQLKCECENRLSNCLFPNNLEGEIKGVFEVKKRDVWECDQCGRLAIDIIDEDGNIFIKWYIPQNGEVGHLFGISNAKDYVLDLINNIKDSLIIIEEIERESHL